MRIEVHDLGRHEHRHLVGPVLRRLAVDAQPQKAAPAPAPRHQHAAVDGPGDRAAVGVELVLRLVEPEQDERAAQEHDVARVLAVEHPDQPEREARQEAPVGARQPLQVLGRPDLLELGARDRDLGHLPAPERAVLRVAGLRHLHDRHAPERAPVALEQAARVARPHRSSTSTRSPAASSPSPGAIIARPSAPSIEVSMCEPCSPVVSATRP